MIDVIFIFLIFLPPMFSALAWLAGYEPEILTAFTFSFCGMVGLGMRLLYASVPGKVVRLGSTRQAQSGEVFYEHLPQEPVEHITGEYVGETPNGTWDNNVDLRGAIWLNGDPSVVDATGWSEVPALPPPAE